MRKHRTLIGPIHHAQLIILGGALGGALGFFACGPVGPSLHSDSGTGQKDGGIRNDAVVLTDATPRDSGNIYDRDAAPLPDGCVPEVCSAPVPMGCQTQEICGNGLDDDCNGIPDDTCTCVAGQVQPCFIGPPGWANVGACQMGTQTCFGGAEFGFWGPCENGTWPSAEVCDGLDNSCNGCIDDGLCCPGDIVCPDPTQVAAGQPFVPYYLDGTQWYSGPATSWSWTVSGGPCDAVLGDSFTVTGGNTATPTINFTLSGDYPVTMTVQTPEGPKSCSIVVHVAGPGLRVELCWEGTGSRDIDLHMLREDFRSNWCNTTYDCHFMNCKTTNWSMSSWGYAGTNPRLDIDNIFTPGVPENINVDYPNDGEVFRVMVHYYSGSGEARPLVNIYCEGHRVATYGQAPDQVSGFFSSSSGCMGHTWRVADVTTSVTGGVTSCNVDAVHPPGDATSLYIRTNSSEYN